MAYNSHNFSFFLIAIVLFSIANQLAHGQLLGGGLIPNIIPPFLTPILSPIIPGLFPPITLPPILPLSPPITLPPILPLSPPITLPSVPPLSPPTLTNGTIIIGTLCCTSTGSCPGTPVSGALVGVNCTTILGTSVLVGQNTTGVNGTFNISIPNILGLVPNALGTFPCIVTVNLPLNQTICPTLSTVNGLLIGIVGTTTSIITKLLGLVQVITLAGYVNLGA